MSDSGQGPQLYHETPEYRLESFIDGRPLTIWELRNPIIASKAVKAIFDMHTKSGVAEAMQKVRPLEESKLGVEIAIDEWGPATEKRIKAIR